MVIIYFITILCNFLLTSNLKFLLSNYFSTYFNLLAILNFFIYLSGPYGRTDFMYFMFYLNKLP